MYIELLTQDRQSHTHTHKQREGDKELHPVLPSLSLIESTNHINKEEMLHKT